MSESNFSEISAQDTKLAVLEAQEWIEAVVGEKFAGSSFRESLQDGILLCKLMNKVNPGSIRRINKSRSPIAYLDNIQQFLYSCQDLDMKNAQLFDVMDLQAVENIKKTGVKRDEADRRIRSVCVTLYWLGKTVAEMEDYNGPNLDLSLFKSLLEGNFSEEEDEQPNYHHSTQSNCHHSPISNGNLNLTSEQEQTADELLANIQNAVDEMLHDFQASPVAITPPQYSNNIDISAQHVVHISSNSGGFGFQVMGGEDSDFPAQVDYIVPGSAAENSGLLVGDFIISVNGQNIRGLAHFDLVSIIKKAGQEGEVHIGVARPAENRMSHSASESSNHVPLEVTSASQQEPHERWEKENEEKEEIARMYPQRNVGTYPIENGVATGPPTIFGREPLPPLVEHQEEDLFEQIQEMIEAVPPPTISPPPSSSLSLQAPPSVHSLSLNSSHPTSSSPINQLHNDKESIEQEIQELMMIEAMQKKLVHDNSPNGELDMVQVDCKQQSAIKVDSFRVEESTSPQPLMLVTKNPHTADIPSSQPTLQKIMPEDVLEEQLNELMKFSESINKEEEVVVPDLIVTPPPMFDSPPPPMPTSAAPKRVAKRPAPPPPPPKPKLASTSKPEEIESVEIDSDPEADSPLLNSLRSDSPDLVTQMQELAYSKRIVPLPVETKPIIPGNEVSNSSSNLDSQSDQGVPKKEEPPVFLPQSMPPRIHTPTSFDRTVKSTTHYDIEVLGDIKIHRVQKTRWRPKSAPTETFTSIQSPDKEQEADTLPISSSMQNGESPETGGAGTVPSVTDSPIVVVARGIGNGVIGGIPQDKKNISSYQSQTLPHQQPWKSQEELRINTHQPKGNQQMNRTQRLASAPVDYTGKKSLSLTRGAMEERRKNYSNTWAANDRDGYLVAYATQAINIHDLCSRCHQPLGHGNILAIPELKTQYHVQCLACHVCKVVLSQDGQNVRVMMKSMRPHCRFCVSTDSGTVTTEC